MTILLCDDHVMFAEALQTVLRREGYAVEITTRPAEALERVQRGGVDVVVMDLSFPDQDGIEAIRRIAGSQPSLPVLVLTASVDSALLGSAAAGGAVAIVDKGRPLHETIRLVKLVAAGHDAAAVGRSQSTRGGRRPTEAGAVGLFLTDRERDVLARLVRGEGTREIAADLGVAYATARGHIQNVLDKLGVHSRLEAVAYAVRHRLLDTR